MRGAGAAALVALLGASGGCVRAGGAEVTTSGGEFTGSPLCAAFDPLLDLQVALGTAAIPGSSPTLLLVDADEELGYAKRARRELSLLGGREPRELEERIGRLSAGLESRRGELASAVARLGQTYAQAESLVDVAAVCQGVDSRELSAPPGQRAATRGRPRVDDERPEDEIRRARAANVSVLSAPACEPSVRLWSTVRQVDLTSAVSVSSVAAHLGELALDKARSQVRVRLKAALDEHAAELRRFEALAAPREATRDAGVTALAALRSGVLADLDGVRRGCLESMRVTPRVVGGDPEPRRATVIVRPKWPASVESLPGAGGTLFGSGFVVRWRGPAGQLETRIVTNNHVMSGALEAEIVPGDPELKGKADAGSAKAKGWSAVLVEANPYDDVAVLRLSEPGAAALRQGLTFRLTPATEQEQVVAAGFPGVGTQPSFQISRGFVSNARFGLDAAEGQDVDPGRGYVQHTAAIDPGNSGGPLLDGKGRLIGMNTLKIVGRESVGLAVPTARIQQAMMRAGRASPLEPKQAEASCNAVVSALSSERPSTPAIHRFGLALFEKAEPPRTSRAARYREQLTDRPDNPIEEARTRAYGAVRTKVDDERGVRPFELCKDVRELGGGRYGATLRTRLGSHELVLADERGVARLVDFK